MMRLVFQVLCMVTFWGCNNSKPSDLTPSQETNSADIQESDGSAEQSPTVAIPPALPPIVVDAPQATIPRPFCLFRPSLLLLRRL